MSLEIREAHIRLGDRVLFDGLDVRVQPGEVLAVMGPSGSGKSTLLAWLCGTLDPAFSARGRILLDGSEIHHLPLGARQVGILFQDDLLFPHMSVRENLLFALRGGSRVERRARCDAALADASLAGLGDRMPATLSGGQRARVSMLRALLAAPRALLLDEPFSRLDARLRERFRAQVFAELARRGVPTVLVTHDVADVPAGARVVQVAAQGESADA
jgi:putative thiamine transport system ATP-binding protein